MIFVLLVSFKSGTSLRFYFAEVRISSPAQKVGDIYNSNYGNAFVHIMQNQLFTKY
jgi:hypothetical protein